jgi:hypothetical protein
MPAKTAEKVSEIRMISQQLTKNQFHTGSEMVEWFGAVQGQEYALTKWSLGMRIPHLTEIDIERELNDGKILRTHLMRTTWHFVHSHDIRMILKLTAQRMDIINAFMYRKLELDTSVFKKSNDILIRNLGGQQLTRAEISDILQKNKIAATGMRLGYLLMKAEIDGIVCSGARQGKQFTYALLDDRVPSTVNVTLDEALAIFTRKYFRSHGPATIHDFAVWSGLTVSTCRTGIDSIISELRIITINSRAYYFFEPEGSDSAIPEVPRLLPVYDEFIMGYKDRSAIFELLNENQNRGDLFFNNMILIKDQVIGTWRRSISRNQMEFEFNLLAAVSRIDKARLKGEAKRFADFFGYNAVIPLKL